MSIKIPPRKYLTFRELLLRWQCTENDLRYLIVNGELKPAVKATEPLKLVDWEYDPMADGCVPCGHKQDAQGFQVEVQPTGWLYLQSPGHIAPLNCEFRLASRERDPDVPAEPWDAPLYDWFWLPHEIEIASVELEAAFLMEEVLRYESIHDIEAPQQHRAEKSVGTRERDTLLSIIAVVCREAKLDYSKSSKTAALIQGSAARLGISIGETTIEGHLKKIPDALAARMR